MDDRDVDLAELRRQVDAVAEWSRHLSARLSFVEGAIVGILARLEAIDERGREPIWSTRLR